MAARVNRSTGGEGPLDADRARALAETLHRGQRDAGGAPLIDHVRRVAAAVPPEARVVAWLHELLEHTAISEAALLMEGLTTAELRGPGAGIAHGVKRADLMDRMRHPSIRPDGWSPPYELGLEVLLKSSPRTGSWPHETAWMRGWSSPRPGS